jgi:hypothetical protein
MIYGIDQLRVDIHTRPCVGRLRVHDVYQPDEQHAKPTSTTGTYYVWGVSSSEGLSVLVRTRPKCRSIVVENAMTNSLVVGEGF